MSRVERWSVVVLAAVGALALAGNLIVAFAHLYDRYHVSHVSGVWMALMDADTFYPPLFQDGYFGGTRYWPLSILWNDLFELLTGDLIAGMKLASIVSMLAIAGLMYAIIRDRGAPRAVAFGFATVGLSTEVGFMAFTAPYRGDTVSAALVLAALYVATRPNRTMRHVVLAGALCGITTIFKVTSVPALGAIGAVLMLQDRRQLLVFVGVWIGVVLLVYGGFHVGTDGRMTENLTAMSTSSLNLGAFFGSPGRLLYLLVGSARVVWIGMVLTAVAVALQLGERRLTIYQIAWAFSLAVVLFLLADPGISYNHCLELLALTVICVAELWSSHAASRALVAIVIAWVGLGDFDRVVSDDLRAIRRERPEDARDPLGALAPPDARILSEDVAIPVLRGQRPIVLDPWTLPRLRGRLGAEYQALIGRIESEEFDRVVLIVDPTSAFAREWYQQQLGLDILDAILAHYEVLGVAPNGYFVLAPRASAHQ